MNEEEDEDVAESERERERARESYDDTEHEGGNGRKDRADKTMKQVSEGAMKGGACVCQGGRVGDRTPPPGPNPTCPT